MASSSSNQDPVASTSSKKSDFDEEEVVLGREKEPKVPQGTTSKSRKQGTALTSASPQVLENLGIVSQKNVKFHATYKALVKAHSKLFEDKIRTSFRELKLAKLSKGSLHQTTISIPAGRSSRDIAQILRDHFLELFREHSESPNSGFEVVTTFNAILTNQVSKKAKLLLILIDDFLRN